MSYILDALKKLEQKRQRDTLPGLLTVQENMTRKTERRLLLPYILAGALLLNAGLLLWWLQPWKTAKPPIVARTDVKEKTTASAPADVGPQQFDTPASNKRPEGKKDVASDVPALSGNTVLPKGDIAVKNKAIAPSEKPVSLPEQHPVSEKKKGENAVPVNPVVNDRKIYSINDLPSAVLESLPRLSVSLHYYTIDPASRLTRINNKTVREGETVTDSLRLEEITQSGLVFNYRGYRFLMSGQF